jgi:hypothetical protein
LSRGSTEKLAAEAWSVLSHAEEELSAGIGSSWTERDRAMARFASDIGAVLGELAVPWMTVWMCVEIDSASVGWFSYYADAGSADVVHSFRLPDEAADAFRRLRETETALLDITASAWTTATMTARREDGAEATFRLDYSYDPVPIEQEMARRRQWKATYLPAGARVVNDP